MIGIKANTVEEYEQINNQIVGLLNLNCRYCGQENKPDINLIGGGYGVPFPDKKKHQDKLIGLNWVEIEILQQDEI